MKTWIAVLVMAVAVSSPVASPLESARQDLVELRFEEALAAIERVLADPELADSERADAWILRSQVHVAFGDAAATERDFREILRLRPGWVPEARATPSKAMKRFERIRKELVGRLTIRVDPPGARLELDGRVLEAGQAAEITLLAGAHTIRAEQRGFDAQEREIAVEADTLGQFDLRLVPNRRSLIVVADQGDVAVTLDGRPVGSTRAVEGLALAELTLELLPPGEHVLELSKPCFRNERRREVLTVDLLDHAPKRLPPIRMIPSYAGLTFAGGPPGAELRLDGKPLGRLPLEPQSLCPGEHAVEVRYGGRVIWASTETLTEAERRSVQIVPRPNLALIGAVGWPEGLTGLAGRFNETIARGPTGADLSRAAGWRDVPLPDDTDLAVAVVPADVTRAQDAWFLYSPILRRVARIEKAPATAHPRWFGAEWGFTVVDSRLGGPTLVVQVEADGPAAAAGLVPGANVVSVGGSPVGGAQQLHRVLDIATPNAPLALEWTTPTGERRQANLNGVPSVRLPVEPLPVPEATIRAGWAVVDATSDPERAAPALSNLALLYGEFGHHEQAAGTWRRVQWGERAGIGNGTVQYYLGRELERLGREAEAAKAYRAAAAGDAAAFHDAGPRIQPAARDRLADLGQRPD